MIEQDAVVTRTGPGGQVWIKSLQAGACGGCMQQKSCGTAALAEWLPKREFAVDCEQALQVGDQVRVGIEDGQLLSVSLLLYLVPLLAMLAAVGVGQALLPPDATDDWLPAIALTALLAACGLIHRWQGFLLLYFCFKPYILGKSVSRSETAIHSD